MHQQSEKLYLLSIRGGRRQSPRWDAARTYLALALFLVLFVLVGTDEFNTRQAERQTIQAIQR